MNVNDWKVSHHNAIKMNLLVVRMILKIVTKCLESPFTTRKYEKNLNQVNIIMKMTIMLNRSFFDFVLISSTVIKPRTVKDIMFTIAEANSMIVHLSGGTYVSPKILKRILNI